MSYCQNCADLTRALFEARAQLDAVEQQNAELRRFARHRDDCRILGLTSVDIRTLPLEDQPFVAPDPDTIDCSCGFAQFKRALAPKAPTTTPPRETSEEKLAAMAAYTAKLERIQRAPGGTPGGSLRGEAFAIVCHETGRELRKILTRCCKRDHNADGDCYAHLRPDRMEGHLAPREER